MLGISSHTRNSLTLTNAVFHPTLNLNLNLNQLQPGTVCICGAVCVGSPSKPPASKLDNHNDNDLPCASCNVNCFTNTTNTSAADDDDDDDDSYVIYDCNGGDIDNSI